MLVDSRSVYLKAILIGMDAAASPGHRGPSCVVQGASAGLLNFGSEVLAAGHGLCQLKLCLSISGASVLDCVSTRPNVAWRSVSVCSFVCGNSLSEDGVK